MSEPMSAERLAQIVGLKNQARTADERELAQAVEELISEVEHAYRAGFVDGDTKVFG